MRQTAIIADDVELNREILADMLKDRFHIVEASNGIEALQAIRDHFDDVAVLLLDLIMPVLDGIGVLERVKEYDVADSFPILIISADDNPDTEEKCLSYGVTDFIRKPFRPDLVLHRIKNATTLYDYRYELENKVTEQTKEILQQSKQLQIQNAKLEEQNLNVIELLGNVVEARNLESGTHVRRVKEFTRILTSYLRVAHPELGITVEEVDQFGEASVMHDLGKIMISDTILLKPGKLTNEEFEEMKRHTLYGCDIIKSSRHLWDERYYELCLAVCRHHHEKWDGRGYPDGLRENEIPLVAQIVSVADCFDALTTERPYKKPFSCETAFEMISTGQCGVINPVLMEALADCRDSFCAFVKETSNPS